ncbi:glycosyltransferase [Halorubrum halodurans]|uniref:Glycosyl transferase family 1 domain-containing protein n=1 Tax=Halorubrum halodurans TaxID=1383851 RepID=A0A256IHL1_9EURY|nr:glycosyltransferase [Halorubrum halodurans]OYR55806.1 hypothetical protein DJ70_10820 [Halorubrum halodurans]
MEILLFDQNTGGHHAEYAGRLLNSLSEFGIDADILASKDSRVSDFVMDSDIIWAKGESEQNLRQLFDTAFERKYDAVHILYLDDIIETIDSLKNPNIHSIPVIATLNGSFFNHFFLNEVNASVLHYGPSLSSAVPRGVGFSTALKEYYLQRIVREGKINNILVHSYEGKKYIEKFINSDLISPIPDPVKVIDHNISRKEARELIGVDEEGIQLLFFGELRKNKGVKFLLKSLRAYEGPRFRLLIAGSPADVERAELESLINSIHLPVVERLKYIEESQIPYYFLASDGVLIPYKQEFGSRRTSGVFQKACGYGRPVIASDFGVIGRQTKQYDAGPTFEPGSTPDLNKTIADFVKNENQMYDQQSLEEFGREHSFEQLSETLSKIYRTVR